MEANHADATPNAHADKVKKSLSDRLKKIRGQVDGIGRLLDSDGDCIDIINQCKAVKGAISKIEEIILERHLRSCLVKAVRNNTEATILEDIIKIYRLTDNDNKY